MISKYYAHSDDYNFQENVEKILLYRKIISVEQVDNQTAKLVLDNGTILTTYGNDGCGGCSNGWYYLEELNGCDNVITNVECVCDIDNYCNDVYHIYVFADDKKVNCLQYEGHDNGYYGTGYSLYVEVGDE